MLRGILTCRHGQPHVLRDYGRPRARHYPPPAGNIPQPPAESSAVSTMLNEPGTTVNPLSGCSMPPSGGYVQEAGNCDTCGDTCWRQRLLLALVRLGRRPVYDPQPAEQGLHLGRTPRGPVNQGYFNDMNWTWGGQATVGYRFGCGCDWALEGTYWGLAESLSDGGPGIPALT